MPIHVGAILRMRNMQRPLEKQGDQYVQHVQTTSITNSVQHYLLVTIIELKRNRKKQTYCFLTQNVLLQQKLELVQASALTC